MTPSIRLATAAGAETEATAESLARLAHAVRSVGLDEVLREGVVSLCRDAERRFGLRHGDVRELITGPIVDALHQPGMMIRKSLADGTVFDFSYKSKIARDFVLSPDARPDHVWEPQTTRLLVHFSRGSKHAIIGGGYIGDHAIFVARALKSGGTCHAFEPNAASAELMRANAANNRVANLVVSRQGLWNQDDARIVMVGDDSHAHPVVWNAGASGDEIVAVTLDSYARNQGIGTLDLLMLDIEGGEQAALEGAAGFLRRPADEAPVVVFEVHRAYVDWSNGLENTPVVRMMIDAGYEVFAIRDFQSNVPMEGCMIELVPVDEVYLEGPPHGFNMLAIKRGRVLDPSVFRVCARKSPKLLLHKEPRLHHPTEWLERLPSWLQANDE